MKNFDSYYYEEEFHKKKRKEEKQNKKFKNSRDKSKYKKTDSEKLKKEFVSSENAIKGRVLSIQGEEIKVSHEEQIYICKLKGLMKKDFSLNKNIIAVGDFVQFIPIDKTYEGSIEKVEERFSILSREEIIRRRQQIIAVNIDQVLITTSVVIPPIKPGLIDRYIIAAEKGNMKPIIVINKIDLLEENSKEEAEYKEFLSVYEKLNIPILSISVKKKKGLESLKNLMKNKASVFSGQSGVGKSSIINLLFNKKLKTGDVVEKTYKGSHVTTTSELIPLEDGGFCIDTPGIKSFGVWNLDKTEIAQYFSEITHYAQKCKYPDCKHIDEPECNVKKAIKDNKISHLRYESYCLLINEASQKKVNR